MLLFPVFVAIWVRPVTVNKYCYTSNEYKGGGCSVYNTEDTTTITIADVERIIPIQPYKHKWYEIHASLHFVDSVEIALVGNNQWQFIPPKAGELFIARFEMNGWNFTKDAHREYYKYISITTKKFNKQLYYIILASVSIASVIYPLLMIFRMLFRRAGN